MRQLNLVASCAGSGRARAMDWRTTRAWARRPAWPAPVASPSMRTLSPKITSGYTPTPKGKKCRCHSQSRFPLQSKLFSLKFIIFPKIRGMAFQSSSECIKTYGEAKFYLPVGYMFFLNEA